MGTIADRHKDKDNHNYNHNNYNKYYICRLWTVIDIWFVNKNTTFSKGEEVFKYYISTYDLYKYEGGLQNVDINQLYPFRLDVLMSRRLDILMSVWMFVWMSILLYMCAS